MVDYLIPVINDKYRHFQPLSLLIWESMTDAIENGYARYNFQGTWPTQEGVYMFKKSWGAIDYPYSYYIQSWGDESSIKRLTPQQVFDHYPYFYVLPYNLLEG